MLLELLNTSLTNTNITVIIFGHFLQVAADTQENSVECHQQLEQQLQDFSNWLQDANQQLTAVTDMSGNQEAVQVKQDALQVMRTFVHGRCSFRLYTHV